MRHSAAPAPPPGPPASAVAPSRRARPAARAPLPAGLPVLLFVAAPATLALLAGLALVHVLRAGAPDQRLRETADQLRIGAEQVWGEVDAMDHGRGLDARAVAADLDGIGAMLGRVPAPLQRASGTGSHGGDAVWGDLERARTRCSHLRSLVPALGEGTAGSPARASAESTLHADLPELHVALTRLALELDHDADRDTSGRMFELALLVGILIAGILAGAILKLVDLQRQRHRAAEVRRLSLVARKTKSSVAVAAPDGRIEWVNEAFEFTTGWNRSDAIGEPITTALGVGATGGAGLAAAIATGGAHAGDHALHRRDGTPYWGSLELVPVRDSADSVRQFLVVFSDATRRVEATRNLAASESRFRSVVGAMSEGLIVLDPDGTIVQSNPAAARILGLSQEALAGRSPIRQPLPLLREDGSRVPGEALPGIVTLRTGEPQHGDVLGVLREDGERSWILAHAEPFESPGGAGRGAVVTFVDITQRKRNEETLRVLTQVVDESPAVVMVTDSDNRLLYVNRAFETRTGWSLAEAAGRTTDFMLSDLTPASTWDALSKALDAGSYWRGEIHNVARDGAIWLADSQVFALRGPGGKVTHYVALIQDITEQRRREQELGAAREAAVAAERTKSEFLQNMSHELRTPLNGILGMSELMLLTPLDAGQRADLVQMRRSAEDLLTVINHLFDFVRVEAGGSRELVPFRLRGCLRDVDHAIAREAEARGLAWEVRVDDAAPDGLVGDPGALRQVLLSLAGNACKFTDTGSVELRVLFEGEDAAGARLRFSVRDTGIGIAPDRQADIFAAFSQLDGSTTRRYGGIGLGLALASRLVQQMGGRLDVESRPGAGSTFSFSAVLPLAPPVDGVAPPPAEAAPLEGRRVLLVAGSGARLSTRAALERAGARMACVGAVPALVEALGQGGASGAPWDALVLDVRDGEVDAFALVTRLRESGTELPPVLVLTGAGERGDADRCAALGIAGYLASPATDADLVDALGHLGASTGVPAPLVTRHLLREARAARRVLLVDDNAVNRKVASRLLERAGYDVTQVEDGAEAVEQCARHAWDVVLMDVQMPGMDGLEATRRIRAAEAARGLRRTPIIAVTAHTLDSDVAAVHEAGMDDLVPKPVQAETLVAAIQARIAALEAGDAASGSAAGPPSDVLDWDDALARMDGDADVLRKLLGYYRADAPQLMSRLEEARMSGDPRRLEHAAHSLKGASGTISATTVQRLAAEMELLAREGRMPEAAARFDAMRAAVRRLSAVLDELAGQEREAA